MIHVNHIMFSTFILKYVFSISNHVAIKFIVQPDFENRRR